MSIRIEQKCDSCGKTRVVSVGDRFGEYPDLDGARSSFRWVTVDQDNDICRNCIEELLYKEPKSESNV